MMFKYLTIIQAVLLLFSGIVVGGEENFKVPELKAMHEVIHPMWHDAYPNKDFATLKRLYPEIEQHFQALQKVTFPANMEDKAHRWKMGLTKMEKVLKEYQQAVEKNQHDALLTATKDLHDVFEYLVKVVNPPLPEADAFHQVLFKVFHDYLPNEKWDKIRQIIPEFQSRMKALQGAALPKKLASKQEKFNTAVAELSKAVEELAKQQHTTDNDALKAAVMKVHDAYENLEKILE